MAPGGGKHLSHPCSRALGPDRGSSAPGRTGIGRSSDPWRQPASAQPSGDRATTACPAVASAGSGASRRVHVAEGASARGALGSCMRRRLVETAPMARRSIHTGEEHDLRSFKKMLLGAVAAMVIVAGAGSEPGIGIDAAADGTVTTTGQDTQNANVPVPRLAGRARAPRLRASSGRSVRWRIPAPRWIARWIRSTGRTSSRPSIRFSVKTVGDGVRHTRTWHLGQAGHRAHQGHRARVHRHAGVVARIVITKDLPRRLDDDQVRASPRVAATSTRPISAARRLSRHAHGRESDQAAAARTRTADHDRHRSAASHQHHRQGQRSRSRPTSQKWGLGDHLTLPDDWGRWAAVAAPTTVRHERPRQGRSSNWDIHDDSLLTEGHTSRPDRHAVPAGSDREGRSTRTSTPSTTAPARAPARAASRRSSATYSTRRHARSARSIRSSRFDDDALRRQGRRG